MDEIRVLTPTGMLGYGFPEENFWKAMERKPHIIAVDSGSTDSGLQKLGNGSLTCSVEDYIRDISILLKAAHQDKIPVYISSAGGAGSNCQVDLFVKLVKEISNRNGYSFRIAKIYADIDKSLIKQKIAKGQVSPCGPIAPLTDQDVDDAVTIVAQMGVEPYLEAMDNADIIISGRSYDPVPIAAMGIRHGFDSALCWHMGKMWSVEDCARAIRKTALWVACAGGHLCWKRLGKKASARGALLQHTPCTKTYTPITLLGREVHWVHRAPFLRKSVKTVSRYPTAHLSRPTPTPLSWEALNNWFSALPLDPLADDILDEITTSVRETFRDNDEFVDIIFHVYGINREE